MKLVIHKLNTRCRRPRGVQSPATMMDDVARVQLAPELQAQLGPSLDHLPAVIRLKQLKVSVKIPARELSRAKLASAWARAFVVALHQSLAHPPGDGAICSRRYPSEAAYKAAMLHRLATEGWRPVGSFPSWTDFVELRDPTLRWPFCSKNRALSPT